MITDHQVQRNGSSILLGIAVGNAVLDVVTSDELLRVCLTLLDTPHRGLVNTKMGAFGSYPISLTLSHDDSVSIFVDGPNFEPSRDQGAGIYLEKEELRQLIIEALQGSGAITE